MFVRLNSYDKAVARGGATGACAPPFSNKATNTKQTISFVEYFVFTPTILNANMFIYHFI